jgi:hypothetical protein
MKFYKDKSFASIYNSIIIDNMLDAVWSSYGIVFIVFFKNGKAHNSKSAAYIRNTIYKEFYLNGMSYGNSSNFTKESWRRFTKLQAFL